MFLIVSVQPNVKTFPHEAFLLTLPLLEGVRFYKDFALYIPYGFPGTPRSPRRVECCFLMCLVNSSTGRQLSPSPGVGF